MAIELETLEVIIDANLERIEKQMEKVAPFFENTMQRMGRSADKETATIEKNLDMSDTTSKLEKHMEQMNKNFAKQLEMMEKNSSKSGGKIGEGLATGVKNSRKTVGKDIDALVNDINSKMGQAKAQQEKLAFLKSQRQGAIKNGDSKNEVKYDEQIARAQASMVKYRDSARQVAQAMKAEFEAVPATLKKIEQEMLNSEGQIESMRTKLKSMQADYEEKKTPKGSFSSGFQGREDTPESLKVQEKITQQTAKMNQLISKNEALANAYAMVEDRAGQLKNKMASVNTTLTQSEGQTESSGSGMRRFGRIVEQSRGKFSRLLSVAGKFGGTAAKGIGRATQALKKFSNPIGGITNKVTRGTGKMSGGFSNLGTRIGRIAKQVFIFSLVYKGLRLMGQGLLSALNTNEQFSQSLNQIKVNLMTAFYPIYTAILPMINALMAGLAKATAFFAQFIATLFGTTYSAAKQGASQLYDNMQAMNDTGKSADKTKEKVKKLQRSLMGFDEINSLSFDNGDSLDDKNNDQVDKNKLNFNTPTPATPDWISDWVKKAQKLWADFFKPIQQAWNRQGKKVIEAFKYSLGEIWGLTKAVGKSFMEVWTNGSGQRLVENLLILFADVLNIIGDITGAFKRAWEDDGRGTALIQSYFDKWNAVLELLHEIAGAFRNAWNSGLGESIAANILESYTNLNNVIGNLAGQFTKAWKEGGRGTSIFTTLLGFVDKFFDTTKRITKATADWAAKLDFTPLLKSIDGLLKAIEPITQTIFDGLAWAWENLLLPLAGFVIEDALPAFFDYLAATLKILNSGIEIMKPVWKWLWDKMLSPIISWTGGVFIEAIKTITKVLTGLSDWINNHMDIIHDFIEIGTNIVSGLFEGIAGDIADVGTWLKENLVDPIVNGVKKLFGIHSPSTVFAEIGRFLIEGLKKGIVELLSGPINAVGEIWDGMKKKVSEKTGQIWEKSKEIWGNVKDTVGTTATNIKDSVSERFSEAWATTQKTWDSVKSKTGTVWSDVKKSVGDSVSGAGKWVSDKWKAITKSTDDTWSKVSKGTDSTWQKTSKSVSEKAKAMNDDVQKRWSDIAKKTVSTWNDFRNKVTDTTRSASTNASSKMNELKNNVSNRFNDIWTKTKTTWSNVQSDIGAKAGSARDKASNAFSTMKNNVGGTLDGLKKTVSGAFSTISKGAGELPGKIASGLNKGVKGIKSAAGSIANGIVGVIGKAVNGVIKGINWVLGKVGAGKSKLGEWKVPKYAHGTSSHPGGLAMVNDGPGKNYIEAYRTPDGQTGLFPKQRNLLVNLPRGSSVLSGQKTAAMYGGAIPHYAGGIGNWFKEKWDKAKDIASDIWSYASNPGKLLNAAISKFANLKGAVEPTLSMAKGTIGTLADGALGWVKSKFDAGFKQHQASLDTGGSHDGAIGAHGVYKYLVDIANKAMAKYPGMIATSGYRPGDPYSHGKRQAIDIAYPASMNGSSKYFGPANWVFDTFPGKVAYVITQGKVRDRKGMSGTGSSGTWVRWPDNDHYDHLHINGSLGAGDIAKKGSYFGSSAGGQVSNTGGGDIVDRAMAWNGKITNPAQVSFYTNENTLMEGGPLNAIGGRLKMGDIAVDPLFHRMGSYVTLNGQRFHAVDVGGAIKGRSRFDVFVGSSQARAQRLGRRTWQWGYENGGLINNEGIYRLGEGDKKEMVIPLERPNRAMELINEALDYLGVDWTDDSISMPDVFETPSFTASTNFGGSDDHVQYDGGGMKDYTASMVTALMSAIQSMGGTTSQAPNGDLVINIGGTNLARISIKEINEYHRKLGHTELEI